MDSVLNMANMISALCPAPLEQLMLRIPIECMRQKGWAELQTSINAVKAAEIIMVVDDHPNYEVALRKTLSHCNLSSTLFVVSHTSSGIAFGYSEETFARFQVRRLFGERSLCADSCFRNSFVVTMGAVVFRNLFRHSSCEYDIVPLSTNCCWRSRQVLRTRSFT